ncbi:unnamed protein product [Lupinus luteus]|uniref:Uncharacterized protein n=1 Tax=Lupinus luteus TaxID=3873 RepID=A0AAV1WG50_LUPLU
MKDKHGNIFSEDFYDNESSEHSDSNTEVTNASGGSIDSEGQVNIKNRGEIGKNNYSDTHINGTKIISASTSMSSSSSGSSSNGYYGIDTLKFTTSGASTSKYGKDYVSSSESSSKFEVDYSLSAPTSTFQVDNVTHNQKDLPPTASPPIQVMDRSGGYDSARIPSAVFDRNTNPLEWSAASNDSLFSLHIEDNSFSREHMFGEVSMSPELTKSGETDLFSRKPSVIIEEIDTARKSFGVENPQTTEASDEAFKFEERLSEDQSEIKNSDHSASSRSFKVNLSSFSHDSGNSMQSFALSMSCTHLTQLIQRQVYVHYFLKRSLRDHYATVLIAAARSAIYGQPAAIHGQAVSVQIVAGCSATVGTLATQKAVVRPLPLSQTVQAFSL